MPKPEEDLIDRLTLRPEVREKARALLRTAHSKTGPGTGYDIGDAKSGLPAICTYIASKNANYADVTQEVAQKASCLAPKTFVSTLRTVKTALHASNKTPNESPSKAGEDTDPMAYATLISEYKIGQPRRVEKWMKEAQAALVALPRFQHDFASRLSESGTEVRTVVFFWVCRAIKLSTVQQVSLADKYGVSLKVFNRLRKMMDDECVDLMESIRATIREMRKKKAKVEEEVSGAASTSKKSPTSTPSHSRSVSPTKSAMRDVTLTPSLTTNSAAKRKVAFTLSDVVSASEDGEGVFAPPETPSRKRPRRASASTTARVMPVSKAELASAASSSSEGEEGAAADEDIEMSDAVVPPSPSPAPTPRPRPRPQPRLAASTPPIAGPSTPRRRPITTTPKHAYRTPPSARIRLLSDDEDEAEKAATVGEAAEHAEASEDVDDGGDDDDDDALPPSRRFRPVFLDRTQWAQRAPRLAHDRAAAERRTRELVGRWGYPFELLRRASALAKAPAG